MLAQKKRLGDWVFRGCERTPMNTISKALRTILALASLLLVPDIVFANACNTASISFRASSAQYLYAAASPSLAITGNFTIEAWISLASLPPVGMTYTIIGKWGNPSGPNGDAYNSYVLWFQNNGGSYQLQIGTDDGVHHWGGYIDWAPLTNIWYHVAVVYDIGGNGALYVNGELKGTTNTLTTSILDNASPILIGQFGEWVSNPDRGSGYFDGLIDDVRIYNTNRTQTQIQSDYRQE